MSLKETSRISTERKNIMPPLSLMIKPASGLCNLRCSYCFYADEAQNRSQASYGIMELSTLENVLRKALETAEGSCSVCFQGGEPTLAGLDFFRKAVELEERFRPRGLSVQNAVQTNGIGLNADWASFLAGHHFLVGLSVDGTIHTHNAYRKTPEGKDTFLEVMNSAALLNRFQAEYNILTVVNARTAAAPDKIYRYYQKQGFRYLQFIPCLDPLPKASGPAPAREYSLSPEAYGQFLCRLFDLWYEDLQKGCQPYIRQFENYISLLLCGQAESCDMNGRCSVQYVVEADGSVYPCDFFALDEYRLGNLNETDFAHIDARRRELGFLERSAALPEECRSCPHFFLCRNGCQRRRIINPENPEKDYFCPAFRMFFSHCQDRLEQIAQKIKFS